MTNSEMAAGFRQGLVSMGGFRRSEQTADLSGMEWLLGAGCLIAAWTLLRIVSGERENRIAEYEATAKQSQSPSEAAENNSTN